MHETETDKVMRVFHLVRQAWLEAFALNRTTAAAQLFMDLTRVDSDIWLKLRELSGSDEQACKLMQLTERPPEIRKLGGVSALHGAQWLVQLDVQVSAQGDYYLPGPAAPEDIDARMIAAVEEAGGGQ